MEDTTTKCFICGCEVENEYVYAISYDGNSRVDVCEICAFKEKLV